MGEFPRATVWRVRLSQQAAHEKAPTASGVFATRAGVLALFLTLDLLLYLDRGIIPGAHQEFSAFMMRWRFVRNHPEVVFALLQSVFIVGLALSSPILCFFSTLLQRPLIFVAFGLSVWWISLVGCAVAGYIGSLKLLFISRLLSGLGESAFTGLVTPLLLDSVPPERKGLFLGTFYGIMPVGLASGFIASAAIAKLANQWAPTFLFLAILSGPPIFALLHFAIRSPLSKGMSPFSHFAATSTWSPPQNLGAIGICVGNDNMQGAGCLNRSKLEIRSDSDNSSNIGSHRDMDECHCGGFLDPGSGEARGDEGKMDLQRPIENIKWQPIDNSDWKPALKVKFGRKGSIHGDAKNCMFEGEDFTFGESLRNVDNQSPTDHLSHENLHRPMSLTNFSVQTIDLSTACISDARPPSNQCKLLAKPSRESKEQSTQSFAVVLMELARSPLFVPLLAGGAASAAVSASLSSFGTAFLLNLHVFQTELGASASIGIVGAIAGSLGTVAGGFLVDTKTSSSVGAAAPGIGDEASMTTPSTCEEGVARSLTADASEASLIEASDFGARTRSIGEITWKIARVSVVAACLLTLAPPAFRLSAHLSLLLLVTGLLLLFVTQSGLNISVMNCVKLEHRSLALSIFTLGLHIFGDVPGPIFVGFLKDHLAPHCHAGAKDQACDAERKWILATLFSFLSWSHFIWLGFYVSHLVATKDLNIAS